MRSSGRSPGPVTGPGHRAAAQFDFLDRHLIAGEAKIPESPADFTIRLVVAPDLYAALERWRASAPPPRACRSFREHTASEFHHVSRMGDSALIVAPHWPDVIAHAAGAVFSLISRRPMQLQPRFALFMARELIIRSAQDRGIALFHAASAELVGLGGWRSWDRRGPERPPRCARSRPDPPRAG